jgi:hypothetical protein
MVIKRCFSVFGKRVAVDDERVAVDDGRVVVNDERIAVDDEQAVVDDGRVGVDPHPSVVDLILYLYDGPKKTGVWERLGNTGRMPEWVFSAVINFAGDNERVANDDSSVSVFNIPHPVLPVRIVIVFFKFNAANVNNTFKKGVSNPEFFVSN